MENRVYKNLDLYNEMATKLGYAGEYLHDVNLLLNIIANNIGGGSSGLTPEEVEEILKALSYTKSEADDKFIATDNVKTINGESIVGEGDITVGGSAPYVLGELTPDEEDENVFYLSEEDESYLQNNKPEKIVVSPYVLTNILDESVLPCYQAVSYEGDIKYILTVQSGTFIMAVEEGGGGSMPTYDLASMSHEERLQLVADLDDDPSLFGRIRVIRNYVKDGIPFVGLCTFYHHYENDKPTFAFACTRSQDVSGETKSAGFFYNYTINDDGTASSNYMRLSDDANLQIEFAKYLKKDGVKTINGESIVGTGNIEIQGGGGSIPTYNLQNMEAQERLQLISDLLADPTLFNRVNIVIDSFNEGTGDILKCVHYSVSEDSDCYFDFIMTFDAGEGVIITQALLGWVDTDGEFDMLPNMFGTSNTLDTDGSMDEYLAPTVSAVNEKLGDINNILENIIG